MRRTVGIALLLALSAGPFSWADEQDKGLKPVVIYSNDFEELPGPAWSDQKTDITPKGGRRFLGQFGNDEIVLRLKDITLKY